MSKGDFLAIQQEIGAVRVMVMDLHEKVTDLIQQVSHLRKQANSHSIALAAAKKTKSSDAAATEVVE